MGVDVFRWTVFEEIAANGLDVLSKHMRRKYKGDIGILKEMEKPSNSS